MNESSPAVDGNGHTQRSRLRFAVACGIELFSLLVIVGSRGWITQVFADFGVFTSSMTAMALSLVLPAVLILLLIVTISVEVGGRSAALSDRWNAIGIGLGLVCLGIYAIGAGLPLLRLIQNLT